MGKYRIKTDNGTYEIETDDVPASVAAPATMPRPKVPGLDSTPQPSGGPGIAHRVSEYVKGLPNPLDLYPEGKIGTQPIHDNEGGPGQYALMGLFGSGVPSAAAGARAVLGTGASRAVTRIPYIGPVIREATEAGKQAFNETKAIPAQRLAKAIEGPTPEARTLPPAPLPPPPPDYSSFPGLGPRPPTVEAPLPGPIRPPLGAVPSFDPGIQTPRMQFPAAPKPPQPVQPIPAPRLIDRSRISIARPDAEVLVEEAGGGGIPKNVRDPVRERVQKSNLKENQRALEEFRAREAKRSK